MIFKIVFMASSFLKTLEMGKNWVKFFQAILKRLPNFNFVKQRF